MVTCEIGIRFLRPQICAPGPTGVVVAHTQRDKVCDDEKEVFVEIHDDSRDHAAILRSPSQSVRNPTTWFQLGIIGDAGPEIRNGLGAFLLCGVIQARLRPGFFNRNAGTPESPRRPRRLNSSLGMGSAVEYEPQDAS